MALLLGTGTQTQTPGPRQTASHSTASSTHTPACPHELPLGSNVLGATHSGSVSQLRTLSLWKSIIFMAKGKQACSLSRQDVTSSLKVTGCVNNPEKYLRRAVRTRSSRTASKTLRTAWRTVLASCPFKLRSDKRKNQGTGRKTFW